MFMKGCIWTPRAVIEKIIIGSGSPFIWNKPTRNTLIIKSKHFCSLAPVIGEPSLYSVKAIMILDNDGNRLMAKYYDEQFPSAKEQKTFEKNLFNKTHRANAEIIMFEGLTCVYRSNVDLFFYVVGSSNENELILSSVLNGFYEAISQILRRNVEKRSLLENLDAVFLAMDEICDGGIILDCDSSSIVSKVAIKTDDIPIGEQTVSQVIQTAKEQIKWSLLK